jgi:uncharacterized repeat protein (TIGR01451 family)
VTPGTVTTNGSGNFSIPNLQAGSYTVDYTVTGGFANTGTKPISGIILLAGGSSTGENFFEQQRNASISGTVVNDKNGNGAMDAGEGGVSGVTVSYTGGTPATSATVTTNGSGNYTIPNLQAGTYSVSYTVGTGFVNTGVNPINGIALSAGGTSTGNNFFEQERDGSIAGTVFNDLNGNGVADGGEPGLANVTVSYAGGTPATSGTVTTDSNGHYIISNLPAGTGANSYTVNYTPPSGFVNTGTAPLTFALTAGGSAANRNFFAQERDASITGSVYNDLNGNGSFDSGEPGLSNVTVSYAGGTPATSGTVTTDSNGYYTVPNLQAGTYTVDYTPLSGFVNTGTKPITGIVLVAGGSSTSNNLFAQERDASITGTVYNDLNGNGSFDSGEPGLSNVTVSYSGGTPATSGTVTTDSNGNYSIPNLQAGTYTVDYTPPNGFANTGTKPITGIVLVAGGSSTSNNFFASHGADLSVVKTGPSTVVAGESATYTLTVHNAGPASAANVNVADTLPADVTNAQYCVVGGSVTCASFPTDYSSYTSGTNISLGTMSAGGSDVVVKIHVDVPSGEAKTTVLHDSASVSSDTFDIDTSNNTSTLDTTVDTKADLSVTKTDNPDPVTAGTTVEYTLAVHNAGPSDAQNVVVSDTLPSSGISNARSCVVTVSVNCTLESQYTAYTSGNNITVTSTLAAGGNATVKIRVDVNANVANGSTLSDTGSVSSDTTEIDTSNNSATETTGVLAKADLSVTKTDDLDPAYINETITYTITTHNAGPSDAQNVVVTDTLPPNGISNARSCVVTVSVNCTLDSQYTAYTSGNNITAATTLAAGSDVVVKIRVHVDPGAAAYTPLSDTAAVSSATTDTNTSNNSDGESTVVKLRPTNLTTTSVNVQYSDYASLSATLTDITRGGSVPVSGKTITFTIKCPSPYTDLTATGTTNASGLATASKQINTPAGSCTSVKANFAADTTYDMSYATNTMTVTQEDAAVQYTGDTIAQTGTNINLRATVWDSAASGYPVPPGLNPEPGGTIGDITKMWVEFDIYTGGSCLSGSPTSPPIVQVADVGTLGDGIGAASTTFTSSSDGAYCVIPKVVASGGGTNQFYSVPNGDAAGFAFYTPTGQYATGGGWVPDASSSNGKGNFGFNARYNNSNKPQGQMVYVWRGTYNGVAADFVIKSNSLTALSFSGTTFPISATLQGKATIQVNRASDGMQLYSDGNATFTATASDSGKSSGIGSDSFALTVYDKTPVLYKSVPTTLLGGGNVVEHSGK